MPTRIVIIGGGPAGYEAALVAAARGRDVAQVTVIDSDGIGGACVLFDCVPSKTFIASTGVRTELRRANGLGFDIAIEDAKISLGADPQPGEDAGRGRSPPTSAASCCSEGVNVVARPRRTGRRHARHGPSPREGHHTRRQGRRAQGRRGADRDRRQPAGAARRGTRRRANPELAPALRPHRAARTPRHRRLRGHRRGVLQRLHRTRGDGHGGGQPRPDPAARGFRCRRGARGGVSPSAASNW